jgi:hypothetical protein
MKSEPQCIQLKFARVVFQVFLLSKSTNQIFIGRKQQEIFLFSNS